MAKKSLSEEELNQIRDMFEGTTGIKQEPPKPEPKKEKKYEKVITKHINYPNYFYMMWISSSLLIIVFAFYSLFVFSDLFSFIIMLFWFGLYSVVVYKKNMTKKVFYKEV